MREFVSAISAAIVALVLAGCSLSSTSITSGGSTVTQQPAHAAQPATGFSQARMPLTDLLFIANGRSSTIDVYDKRPPHRLITEMTAGLSGPNGMAVDPAGNLFVANVDNQTVTVYPPGSKHPSRKYTRGFGKRLTNPLNVAIGPDGTMYLVNYTLVGQNSEVLEYPPGSMDPTVQIPLNGGGEGLALDAANNLYVSYNASNGGRILKFVPGSTNGQDLGISLQFAGGLLLDKHGNLVACDQTKPAIEIFPPGKTKPSKTITGFVSPYHIAFGQRFERLYVADNASNDFLIFSYPAGQLIETLHRQHSAFGVAVNPAAPFPGP